MYIANIIENRTEAINTRSALTPAKEERESQGEILRVGAVMRTKIRRRCPILVEFAGQMIRSDLFASDAEKPADIAIKIRDKGWKPYRVRFDDGHSAWIVSSLEWH
jgi:hypothetical protein